MCSSRTLCIPVLDGIYIRFSCFLVYFGRFGQVGTINILTGTDSRSGAILGGP